MSQDNSPLPNDMVDITFPLIGRSLPLDYPQVLRDRLLQELPWLANAARAGVHPVKLVHGSGTQSLLSGRSRLSLRVPRSSLDQAGQLSGRSLQVGEQVVRLGSFQVRELLAHATLYAHAVAARNADEADFVQWVAGELSALGLRSPWICGRQSSCQLDGQPLTTFSLMVHQLAANDSLRLQAQGLGQHRLLGCGIFIPHKNTAAVGD